MVIEFSSVAQYVTIQLNIITVSDWLKAECVWAKFFVYGLASQFGETVTGTTITVAKKYLGGRIIRVITDNTNDLHYIRERLDS